MSYKMQYLLKTVLALSLFLCASGLGASQQERETLVKRSIEGYTFGLAKAAKTRDAELLRYLTTQKMYVLTSVWIESWFSAMVYMDARLDTINYKTIEILENRATVETDEKWFYTYRFMKDHKVVYPQTEILYKARYTLLYKKGRWMVDNIEILSEKEEVDNPDILIRPLKEANKRPYVPGYAPPEDLNASGEEPDKSK